jgi:hypothetical protein
VNEPTRSLPPWTVPPEHELELFALFADHPKLVGFEMADEAFWKLTDRRLRDLYFAVRGLFRWGQRQSSVIDLAHEYLPATVLPRLLSKKYAAIGHPHAVLERLVWRLSNPDAVEVWYGGDDA